MWMCAAAEITFNGIAAGEIVPKATRLVYTRRPGRDDVPGAQMLPSLHNMNAPFTVNYSVHYEPAPKKPTPGRRRTPAQRKPAPAVSPARRPTVGRGKGKTLDVNASVVTRSGATSSRRVGGSSTTTSGSAAAQKKSRTQG